jgi:hypothetical protein
MPRVATEMEKKQVTFASVIGTGMLMATAAIADPYNPGERALGGGLLGAVTGVVIGAMAGGGRGAGTRAFSLSHHYHYVHHRHY